MCVACFYYNKIPTPFQLRSLEAWKQGYPMLDHILFCKSDILLAESGFSKDRLF